MSQYICEILNKNIDQQQGVVKIKDKVKLYLCSAVLFLIRIGKVLGSNLGWDIGYSV
jgi:hypothetical protein